MWSRRRWSSRESAKVSPDTTKRLAFSTPAGCRRTLEKDRSRSNGGSFHIARLAGRDSGGEGALVSVAVASGGSRYLFQLDGRNPGNQPGNGGVKGCRTRSWTCSRP